MGALISVLVSGIPSLIASILAFMTRKLATAAGSITAFLALTVVFIACNRAIFDTLGTLLNPPPFVAAAVGMFIPADFLACLGALISAQICRAAYDMAREKIRLINNAS